uniref:non-specific serine/threonine protein kinase n=1 Tax=Pygocentrus nattereri TaxID=42514 RepID=A0AAR2J8R6_PYGNA
MESRKSWIQATFYKRECVKFLPASRDHHGCSPVCHVCQNLVRCCCGRLIGEHAELESSSWVPPASANEETWSVAQHTRASPTDAFGSIDFQGSTKRCCRAKFVRLSCDAKLDQLLCLMLREWNMVQPKLVISVHGGTENFPLPPRVGQAFSKGLIRAAETTGAWILTDGFNTGVSMYVGDAVKVYGTHERRKRNIIGVTPWGLIENHNDLIGRDVLRHYQTLGNPLSKRASLNGLHSHFLLVDDGTLGKAGGQLELRRNLERHIHRQRIHPRLAQRVPVVCVVVEGGPPVLSTVLDYVSRSPPAPVIVFEGTGRAADLLALIHKQTAVDRKLDTHIKEDFLLRIQGVFGVARPEASQLFGLLTDCMEHRDAITIFDSESEDHLEADVAILKASLKGTLTEQLNVTLAWDRADIAQQHILVYGQHWKVGALEQAMLNALKMDRVSFVKLLIENGVTLKHFLTVSHLEELYNTQQGSSDYFLHHIVEDAKKCRVPVGYKISLIDVGMVIEHLIGGAYRSTYRRKSFRTVYNRINNALKVYSLTRSQTTAVDPAETTPPRSQFFRTAEPYRPELGDSSLFIYSVNDLFVWAVLKRRQQMALFLWHHGEQAMARAVVACRLYRAMSIEAKESDMGDSTAEELKKYSLEFGQLAVDLLDKAFKENERMAMKLLTSEMTDWSDFTCLQMAVASGLRPFLAHSCTQMLLNDLWMGRLNMRKNTWFKIIVSILLPATIQFLEFKSQAEMSHVPQTQEALQTGTSRRINLTARWLPWARKVYDFYNAPVVKFWFHTMTYLPFLMLYTYTVLVRMEKNPSFPEWFIITYISSTAVEKVREVLLSEPRRFQKKLKLWFSEYWNIHDFVAILLFFTGFALRWQTGVVHTAGRIIYCLDIIFWFVRVLDLLAINQKAGPYLTMITKMMSNMFYIVTIMGIVLVSFGTPRGSILKPYEDPSWDLLKDVVFQPYFMMFGEVYAGEINQNPDCPPGSFLNPLLQAVYLFMQYIIMVNLLIAFYNNVYIHMKNISNQLWKYNRYRYIMTYQKKPWLPPPLIFFSHMTLCVSSVWHWHKGASGQESNSGLKLFLAPDDRKKLHEFEEKCVAGYFRDKHESQNCSQINRIRSAADKAEEMMDTLSEVAEKVQFIQESLQMLDGHLGHLQDMSAQAVDTLNLLSATDNRQQEAVLLGHSQPIASPYQQLSHSWSLRVDGNVTPSHAPLSPKLYQSTPPSLMCGLGPGKKRPSFEFPPGGSGGLCDSRPKWVLGNLEFEDRWRTNGGSGAASPAGYRLSHSSMPHLWGASWRDRTPCESSGPSCPSSPTVLWARESCRLLSQDESMEEEEEDEEEELNHDEAQSISRTSSHVFLLSTPQSERGQQLGIVNPGFSGDSELARPRRSRFGKRWPFGAVERELQHSRSLSASIETMAMPASGVPGHSTMREDTPPPTGKEDKGTGCYTDYLPNNPKYTVLYKSQSTQFPTIKHMLLIFQLWLTVKSLLQLLFSSHTVTGVGFVFLAMERNNLMRLAHTIPFTPVSLLGGEEVCIYTLEESDSEWSLSSTSSWCQRGHAAMLQPLAHQETLDGGLRRALRVMCTWAEGDVLKPGCVYVVKSFRPEVVRTWQAEFPSSTSLHLCLREIQQQRAAQKLMQVFNQIKPSSVPHSPRFLDVSLLWWQAEGQWLTIEGNMSGDFMKYNNNTGEEISPCCALEETVLAFSHWTYEYTQKELLVLDLQGVGVDLTDPSVIRADDKSSSEDLVFGPANLGDDAVQSFILKHTCNSCCRRLGLSSELSL